MTLNSAMNTAVSALQAQSKALSIISSNLANSSTTAYKTVETSFSTLLTETYSASNYQGSNVTAESVQTTSNQGNIESTDSVYNIAISGSGMFVVSTGATADDIYFTRNGEFSVDDEGYLVNDGYYLLGWATDAEGNVTGGTTTTNLTQINIESYSSSVDATETASVVAGLNPSADTSDSGTSTITVYDSLGIEHTVTLTWTKTDTNEWELSYSADDGTAGGETYTLNFDTSGNLTSVTDSSGATVTDNLATLTFTWTDGSAASTISLDLTDVTQTLSSSTKNVSQTSYDADGYSYGTLESVSIDETGLISATYSNGQTVAIYQIAIATFSNYDGLSLYSDGIYQESADSGDYSLHIGGEEGAGDVESSALEESTVDTADEFTKMIVAQQAYSAASQVITTSKDMYDSLISAVR